MAEAAMATERYDPQAVEAKWQAEWERRGTNAWTPDGLAAAKAPYYNLMMFPYPSAEGLHIGNLYAYSGADVNGRYWRLMGKDVFEPIGFDAFGIHSENHALKVGKNPNDVIPANVANFTRVLKRFGGMYDWNHTVNSTSPGYYKWTQWVFLKLLAAGLAERRQAPVNWCSSCKTVLANEQVQGGQCERCDTPVEQRQLPQWFFKITNYAERLLANLPGIDWSATTKKAQVNWIGRSDGAQVDFPVVGMGDGVAVRVFTTRPDTLFGATYMVLAPEHPLVDALATAAQRGAVDAYREAVRKQDLVERQKVEKDKTGVFTGGFCVNPVNGARIPVWIADYVLMGYGTGAIMAVPGHDARDFAFAERFGLPIRRVIAPPGALADAPLAQAYMGAGTLVNSSTYNGMPADQAKDAIVAALAARGLARGQINYRLHDWCVSRQRYWGPPIPVVHCDACGAVPVPEDELPVLLPHLEDFRPDDSGVSPLARVKDWYEVACPRCGAGAHRETDVTDNFLCSGWYFLRYPSAARDDAPFDAALTRKWLPVDSYIGGNEHAVLHLMYARFLTMALHDIGALDFDEPFAKFRAHGLIIRDGRKMSKSRGNVVSPDAVMAEHGADAMRLYLLFIGPYEQVADYQTEGIKGPAAFLNRLWQSVLAAEEGRADEHVASALHRTIKLVSEHVPALQFNTAIAAMMEYLNVVRAGGRVAKREELTPLVVMLAPFAPHIAEELYERLGHAGGLFDSARWPRYDAAKTKRRVATIVVQVNGKLRGRVTMPADADEAALAAAARADENVARHIAGKSVRQVVTVPGRLVNLVVD